MPYLQGVEMAVLFKPSPLTASLYPNPTLSTSKRQITTPLSTLQIVS